MRYRKQLRANIKAEMSRRDLLQGDVASILGIAQNGVSKRLVGDVDWKFGELLKLASHWDISVSVLIAGTDENPFDENGHIEAVAA